MNIERFNTALGEALSSFPLPAGRLVRPDTPDAPWKVRLCSLTSRRRPLPRINHGMQIRLTNSSIPVSVINNDTDEILPTDFAYQSTVPYVDPLNVGGIINTEGESDEPLFRLTITRFTKLNSTSIAASWSHILCTSSLDLPSSSCCVDENELSRWIWVYPVLQTPLSVVPGPWDHRSSPLLRTRSDQVRRTTKQSL